MCSRANRAAVGEEILAFERCVQHEYLLGTNECTEI